MGQNVFRDQTPYLQTGNPRTENRAQDSYSKGQLGYRFVFADKTDSDRSKGYQLIVQDSTLDTVPSAGAVAYWRDTTGYRVTGLLTNSARGRVAGVYQCAITPDYIGCIQQRGPCLVNVSGTGTPSTLGLIAVPSSTEGTFDTLTAGTAASYPPLGVTLSAASGSPSQALVDLDLPGRE
jgi:hypothetical protein